MSAVERLVKTLTYRGLRILPGSEPGQLLLNGPAAEKTPQVLEAVKAFKPQLLELVTMQEPLPPPKREIAEESITCKECKGTWYCTREEIMEAVQSPHYCATPRCPYRSTPKRS